MWSMAQRPRPRHRIAAVLGLIVLSPIAAEYLIGYDDTIGQPLTLLFGLLILGPLYGCAAVLIREMTRRSGRGWPTMLLLSLVFGLVQAGLIDQSLFNPDYRGIPYWAQMREPTYLPALGTSAYMMMNFLIGHLVRSFAVPIALVETLVGGEDGRRPWLGPFGLVLTSVGYLVGAAFILYDQRSLGFTPSPAQLAGTAVVAIVLVVVALTVPRRGPVAARPAPPAVLVGVLALVWAWHELAPTTWVGVIVDIALLGGLALGVAWWSRSPEWGQRQVLALCGAVLAVQALNAFAIEPLGQPDPVARYSVNAVLAFGVVVIVVAAFRRASHCRPSPLSSADATSGTKD
jgi:hypothetical protein